MEGKKGNTKEQRKNTSRKRTKKEMQKHYGKQFVKMNHSEQMFLFEADQENQTKKNLMQ